MFVLRAENFKEARVTLFLISLNLIFFITFNFVPDYFLLLAQINDRIIYYREIWRLITSMFLHGDVLHIFSNMLALLIFGTFIELHYSKLSYIFIYIISGLIGNIFSLFLLPLYTISLGASGCIFGLIGAAFLIIALQRDKSLLIVGIFYVIYFIITSFSPGINYFAHIFGLIGGIFFGWLLMKRKNVRKIY